MKEVWTFIKSVFRDSIGRMEQFMKLLNGEEG